MRTGYGIGKKAYIELLNQRISGFGKQEDVKNFQIINMRECYDLDGFQATEEIIEIDKKIIGLASELSKVESDNDEEHWAWNLNLIFEGKYPLEKLPDHIRKIAREMYYSD
ncbi:MAG: hypothetical protein WDA74_06590 [Spirochaetota bacterium]